MVYVTMGSAELAATNDKSVLSKTNKQTRRVDHTLNYISDRIILFKKIDMSLIKLTRQTSRKKGSVLVKDNLKRVSK